MSAFKRRFERFTDRLCAIARVNIAPEVKPSAGWVAVETRKGGVVGRFHDVGESQTDDFKLRIPSAKLFGHFLADKLGERIASIRPCVILFINWDVGRRLVEGQAEKRFTRRPNNIPDSKPASRLQHIVRADGIYPEYRFVRHHTWAGNRRQVNDCVDSATMLKVHCG